MDDFDLDLADEGYDSLDDLGPDLAGDSFLLAGGHKNLHTLKDFESYLTNRSPPEKPYGIFDNDVTMCRFFDSKKSDTLLADIERKNREQGMGNMVIPNTNIKLVNFSVCPTCGRIFTFKDLTDYYRSPKPDAAFRMPGVQLREDTRVCCNDCGAYFLPALVIVDGTPKNEVQFLCRMQTVEGVEKFFLKQGEKVLSQKKENINWGPDYITVKNDVVLERLESKPTLITNILQYTPASLALNLIDGSNAKKGDILFGATWKPLSLGRSV
jgi:hypothetical protein